MSRARNARALRLAFCALAALGGLGGCASLGTKDSSWTPPRPGPGGAPGSIRKRGEPVEETPEDNKGLSWSDFSYENISKTTKKLTGRGPNPAIAKQLYREADDLYKQAIAAAPERQSDIFEIAAPKFMGAADRW